MSASRSPATSPVALSGAADYCPKCRERTALVDGGMCPWCDTKLVVKRRGGKPAGKYHLLSDTQLRALHSVYVTQGISVSELARRVYVKAGYQSPGSCSTGIYKGWARLGLERRDRIEAVKLACVTHGHGGRDRDEQEYRRFLAARRGWNALQGPGQGQCVGTKNSSPGKGRRCARHSLIDSEYCFAHDPRRQLARQAQIAKMHSRLSRPDMLPMAPFSQWLNDLVVEHGTMRGVARLLDGSYTSLVVYRHGRGTDNRTKTTIARRTVERYAAAAGTTVQAIYQPEAARAVA